MSDLAAKAAELTSGLKQLAQAAGYVAQVTIINNCPPAWGVVIAAGGVKFFYRDGSDYTDGPRAINLSSGQSATFTSNDPNKCVGQFFAAMTVVVPNEPAQNMTNQDGVPEGQCLIHESVILGPKSASLPISKEPRKLSDVVAFSTKKG